MALIKCPECGNEISDTCDKCIHCGYKLDNNKKENITKRRDKKKILLGISIFLIIILCVVIIFFLNKRYKYKRDGFIGLDKAILLETNPEDFDSIKIYGKAALHDRENAYIYEDIKLMKKYRGNMNVLLDNNDYSTISAIYFKFSGQPDSKSVIQDVSEIVGQPVHKENYNDQRYDKAYIIWKLDEKHYLSYNYNIKEKTAELVCGYFDINKQDEQAKCEKNLEKDKVLKDEYNKINERAGFTDLSMEDVQKKLDVEYDESSDNYSSFKEKSSLFGYDGYFKYFVENPKEDSFDSDFIGQVKFEEFRFDKITPDEEKDIISKLQLMYGEGIKDLTAEKAWYDSPARCTVNESGEQIYLYFSKNYEYCFINPEYDSTDETKQIEPYKDCDEQMFNFKEQKGYKIVTDISTIDECWNLAQKEILTKLKSPSTAKFGSASPASSDVKVTRDGDKYFVESWVDAQNSFGATLRTNFKVTLRKKGRSFEVESSRIY